MHFHLPKPLHGWRAFAGEVGIIVIGVLIALGAEQVVESVHARQKQHETLERLFEESRVDVAQLRERRPGAAIFAAEVDFATELTKENHCPPAAEWDAVNTLGMYPQTTLQTSVYDEVIGAGGLAAIASPRTRDAVATFHAMLSWVQAQTDFFRTVQAMPITDDDPRVSEVYDADASEPQVSTFDRAALCGDRRFRNKVVAAVRNHVVWDNFREMLAQSAIGMCAVLGRDLGRQCTPSEGPPFTEAERRIAAKALAKH